MRLTAKRIGDFGSTSGPSLKFNIPRTFCTGEGRVNFMIRLERSWQGYSLRLRAVYLGEPGAATPNLVPGDAYVPPDGDNPRPRAAAAGGGLPQNRPSVNHPNHLTPAWSG